MDRISIGRANNGYVVQGVNDYGSFTGDVRVFADFGMALEEIAKHCKEETFAATIAQSQNLTKALTEFVALSVKPHLLAIESKINPGMENLVDENDPGF